MKKTKPRKTHLLTKIMKLLTTPHRADCNGSKILSRHVVRYTSFSYPILTGTEREVQIAKPNTGPRPASSIPIKQLSCAQLGAPEDAVTMAFCCKKENRGKGNQELLLLLVFSRNKHKVITATPLLRHNRRSNGDALHDNKP
jgi:hypothetical protein